MEAEVKQRKWNLDNIKGVLIICVVFGHLLELDLRMDLNRYLYTFIYLFHMPVFIFVTGYLSKISIKRTVKNMLYPYMIFQLLYLLFANLVLKDEVQIQFITPYWIMWYLWAITIWSLLCSILQGKSNSNKIFIIIAMIVLSLVIGYIPEIGRKLSLSRVIVFFPFYLAGYYWKERNLKGMRYIAIILLFAILILCGICYQKIDRNWLYEATGYARSNYGLSFRSFHIGVAFICIFILFQIAPNKKIWGLSMIGKNTLSIYLLHGFIIKLMDRYQLIAYIQQLPDVLEAFMLAMIAILLSFLLSRRVIITSVNVLLGKGFEKKIIAEKK